MTSLSMESKTQPTNQPSGSIDSNFGQSELQNWRIDNIFW